MFCCFVLSTSCKPLSPHFPAPWQRSSSTSLLRDCFLKVYQLSLTCFWLLFPPLTPLPPFPILHPISVDSLSWRRACGYNLPNFHWDGQVTLLSSLSSAPGHIFLLRCFSTSLQHFAVVACWRTDREWNHTVHRVNPLFPSFSFPVLTSPSPWLVFEERLFLGVGAPCMAFGFLPPS